MANYAYFHIVVADSRAPDGLLIETLGTYSLNTNPGNKAGCRQGFVLVERRRPAYNY